MIAARRWWVLGLSAAASALLALFIVPPSRADAANSASRSVVAAAGGASFNLAAPASPVFAAQNPLSLRRGLAGRLGRLAVYGALFITIGAIGMSAFVVPRLGGATVAPEDAYPVVLDRMSLTVGFVGGVLLVIAIVIRTLLQYSDSYELDPALTLVSFIRDTHLGRGLALSSVMGAVVALSSALARNHWESRPWRIVQTAGVVMFLFFWASSGHSAAADPLLGLRADIVVVVHVLAAGLWVGMLSVIFVTVLPEAMRDKGRTPMLRATLRSFSSVAMVSAGVMLLTGAMNSVIYLSDLTQLTTTVYGRTLLAKLVLVLVLVGIGVYNWRALKPREDGGTDALRERSTIRLELLIAVVVLVLTSVLVVTLPPA